MAAEIGRKDDDALCTSIIVAAELRYGAAKRQSPRLTRQLETILSAIDILPWDAPYDATNGALRAELEATGRLIGPNDLLIAAQTVSLGHCLVTDNTPEFARVPGLLAENWLR